MKLDETTRTYFERLAEISPPEESARYRSLLTPKEGSEAELYFAKNELTHNSMIHTSISPTLLKGGFRNNVIPSEAEAYLDVRALPDEDMDQFIRQMREVIGDPSVEIKPNPWRDGAPASNLGTEMFSALERTQKRLFPGSVTLPILVTGATDMSQLRVKGVQAYGIGPLMLEKDIKEGVGAHSDNERILEKSLHDFVRFVWYSVLEVAASK
jgi:acetylornithine deacetylase/succinyl-diaminopimelate desuccinylase-like protein